MHADQDAMWVVYQTVATQRQPGRNAVCTQAEWDEKELANPGLNTLIRGGITNEGVAERLARDLQTPPLPASPARGRAVKRAPTAGAPDSAHRAPHAG